MSELTELSSEVTDAMTKVLLRVRKQERDRCWKLAKDAAKERLEAGDPEGAGEIDDLAAQIKRADAGYTSPVDGNHVTMWAELVADEDGERWWRCNEEGSRTEAIDYDILNLTAAGFPVGSRLTISEPEPTP